MPQKLTVDEMRDEVLRLFKESHGKELRALPEVIARLNDKLASDYVTYEKTGEVHVHLPFVCAGDHRNGGAPFHLNVIFPKVGKPYSWGLD